MDVRLVHEQEVAKVLEGIRDVASIKPGIESLLESSQKTGHVITVFWFQVVVARAQFCRSNLVRVHQEVLNFGEVEAILVRQRVDETPLLRREQVVEHNDSFYVGETKDISVSAETLKKFIHPLC